MKVLSALLCTTALAFSVDAYTQRTSSGIYLSADDFYQSRLSRTRTDGKRHCIRLNDFFGLPYVTVINGGRKHTYAKDSIFGIQTCDKVVYRFFKKGTYEVVNRNNELLLYRREEMQGGGRGVKPVVVWYFSKDASSPVLPLTRRNIAAAYSSDTAFVERVYDHFNRDTELSQYDDYHKTYKLIRAYQSSRHTKP